MTIYAHFDGKTDLLRYLWADVLSEMAESIHLALEGVEAPVDRLDAAAKTFVAYWLNNTEHFRLVFMSGDVSRADVRTFIEDPRTHQHFRLFSDLVKDVVPRETETKTRTDMLVCGMIGIALCLNTIADYPWSTADAMTDALLACART